MTNDEFFDFKNFLIQEGVKTGTGPEYFSIKIGDLTTSLQKLSRDIPHMGTRDITDILKSTLDNIRLLLNDNWDEVVKPHLEVLQTVGVALAKILDDNGLNASGTIEAAKNELENLISVFKNPLYSTMGDEDEE